MKKFKYVPFLRTFPSCDFSSGKNSKVGNLFWKEFLFATFQGNHSFPHNKTCLIFFPTNNLKRFETYIKVITWMLTIQLLVWPSWILNRLFLCLAFRKELYRRLHFAVFKRHFVQKIATAIYKTSNKNFSIVDSAKIVVDLSFLDVCQMLFQSLWCSKMFV